MPTLACASGLRIDSSTPVSLKRKHSVDLQRSPARFALHLCRHLLLCTNNRQFVSTSQHGKERIAKKPHLQIGVEGQAAYGQSFSEKRQTKRARRHSSILAAESPPAELVHCPRLAYRTRS